MPDNNHAWRIGLDEAGYGPNLGPLVVAASAWPVPEDSIDLYEALSAAVSRDPREGRLQIADSKAVYKPGGGLAKLESIVLAIAHGSAAWRGLVDRLEADPIHHHDRAAWREGFNPTLPIDATVDSVDNARSQLDAALKSAGMVRPRLSARLVFPEEFNTLCDEHGTKGAALSHTTLGLLRRLVDEVAPDWAQPGPPIDVTLDKHGGRNRYAGLVQHWLPEAPLAVVQESRAVSRYRIGRRLSLTFRAKGEAEMPVALASMTAKLLREISMQALNSYWLKKIPGLKPTAGYPVDAKRYKAEIGAMLTELGIDDRLIWRSR